MKYLPQIVHNLIPLKESVPDTRIYGLTMNSNDVNEGDIFIAIDGKKADGHDFIHQAVDRGASAIISNGRDVGNLPVPQIKVANPRRAASIVASEFYGHPSKHLTVIGITGTNGKTSSTFITREIWSKCNLKSASIGTFGLIKDKYKKKLGLTTEDSIEIHKILSNLYKKKINHVCLEASSHGLNQFRLDGVKLDIAAITNISQDHFDYHKNYNNYFNSKMRLFLNVLKKNGTAIINSDLNQTKRILSLCKKKKIKTFTYGYKSKDLRLINIEEKNNYQNVLIKLKNKKYNYLLKMPGSFQVYNSLCAILIAYFSGIKIMNIIKVIENISQIPGRLEKINIPIKMEKKNISIFIDYAHTPDALEKALYLLKKNSNKLSVVFGCGGNRDKEKRSIMGKIADKLADKVYITDDNPRNESAKLIRKEIISNCKKAIEIKSRYLAIKKAIKNCEDGENLLIAGKGHEDYQVIGKKIYKFSDKNTVLGILKRI